MIYLLVSDDPNYLRIAYESPRVKYLCEIGESNRNYQRVFTNTETPNKYMVELIDGQIKHCYC